MLGLDGKLISGMIIFRLGIYASFKRQGVYVPDGTSVLITTTQEITSLTIALNGATALYGGVTFLGAVLRVAGATFDLFGEVGAFTGFSDSN